MIQIFEKDGKVRSFEVVNNRVMATLQIGGEWVANPTLEAFFVDGWREYVVPEPTPYQPTYEERVVELIRLRYDVNAEVAILRQRDSKSDEFSEYNAYCEECKRKIKEGEL